MVILGAAAGCAAGAAGNATASNAASTKKLDSSSAGRHEGSQPSAMPKTGSKTTVTVTARNVLTTAPMYVNPSTPAATAAAQMRMTEPDSSKMLSRLANTSNALWVDGTWSTAKARVKIAAYLRHVRAQHRVAVIVVFNIPGSHGSRYSGYSGASSAMAYRNWVWQVAAGMQGYTANVAVILEPGALASMENLSSSQQQKRYSLLRYAASQFVNRGVTTYMDAGDPTWHASWMMAPRLKQAWVPGLRGFSVNVGAFSSTNNAMTFGKRIVAALHINIHFVIDTSRNGRSNARMMSWSCNPSNMSIGSSPTTRTGDSSADAMLWIKNPGMSDGTCNGGPRTGMFWTKAAVSLVINVTVVVHNGNTMTPAPAPTMTMPTTTAPMPTPTMTTPTMTTPTTIAPTPVPTVPGVSKW